ncbi:MAG TPA: ATP-binding protein, partial [Candidatus Omnitrophota bacterium]|nr:ATP-binding protein [Candidatus Omnitrophota bacterium]
SVEKLKLEDSEKKLKALTGDLSRSNAELEQFAYIASHDLQEPLRMVASYVQLLAQRYKGKLGTDADEFIGFAVDGALRMRMLINDLLEYSRIGTRGTPFVPVDCRVVLGWARENLKVAIEESGAQIDAGELPEIIADANQMLRLLQNLIANAIKFRKKDEALRILISAREEPGEWLFSVRDRGIGFDMKYAERIFGIFQRLHGREEYSGSGIGLAVCKKIVERHGGRIWAESEAGQGTVFYFTIPIRERNP